MHLNFEKCCLQFWKSLNYNSEEKFYYSFMGVIALQLFQKQMWVCD